MATGQDASHGFVSVRNNVNASVDSLRRLASKNQPVFSSRLWRWTLIKARPQEIPRSREKTHETRKGPRLSPQPQNLRWTLADPISLTLRPYPAIHLDLSEEAQA